MYGIIESFGIWQGEAYVYTLLASAAYVTVELARVALSIVGAQRFLDSDFMFPGAGFAPKRWRQLLCEGPSREVRCQCYSCPEVGLLPSPTHRQQPQKA